MLALTALRIAALESAIPVQLLVALCTVESNLKPNAYNALDNGSPSLGLCQIKQATARDMGFKGKVKLLFNPLINARYAAKYLRYQYNRYQNWYQAIEAYNKGRAGSPKHIARYTKKVLKILKKGVCGGKRSCPEYIEILRIPN